jgi:hypothetical protein
MTNVVIPQSSSDDIFVVAGQIEALLKGKSSRVCLKILNMVGSLHGIHAISGRPIGQPTVGTLKIVPPIKPKGGQSTTRAAWKQTPDYRQLNERRDEMVKTLKTLPPGESSYKTTVIQELRSIERDLKDLKLSVPGNH